MKPREFLLAATRAETDDCIEWRFAMHKTGYGRSGADLAHRAAYAIVNGGIPEGAWILHRCDNRPCINPRHLFLGDRRANIDDMVAKGRSVRGVKQHRAKLDPEKVRLIRWLYAEGVGQRELGRQFGVSQSTIRPLLIGKTWAHV